MTWTKPRIVEELKRLHKSGGDLSYNVLAKRKQSLVSAAAYHFGSYRHAVERAGVDYAEVTRRPRWDKRTIIAIIKQAKRKGRDLHWSAVTKKRDELAHAAYAAIQARLFGRWDRALQAAGLDADDISQYRNWTRNSILFDLRERSSNGDPLNSGAVQKEEPSLHAAAIRHFGSYDNALRGIGLNPARIRERKRWDRTAVLTALRDLKRKGTPLTDSSVRKQSPAVHGAATRLFGSFALAARIVGGKHRT